MKEWLQRHFLSMLSLIALLFMVILVSVIIGNPAKTIDDDQLLNNANVSDVEAFTFTLVDNFNMSPTYKTNLTSDGLSDINNTINNTMMPFNMPVYREVVIVYFKEMPVSVDEFAAAYNVSPVFVKGDIRMAAFESNPVKIGGVVSEKTTLAIESISKDPMVESVKRDTYMFVNPNVVVETTPRVRYPGDNAQEDVEPIPNQVFVGFWRLPPSLEEFGEKYGGKPIRVTEALLSVETVIYEADDLKTFIDLASKDPYVEYIEPNEIVYNVTDIIPNDECEGLSYF